MVFAIDEINKNPNLLPNITLGYHIYDNCVMLGMAFRAALSLASGSEEAFSDLNCTGPPPVIGIVGDSNSTPSIAISSVLGLFRVPIVRLNEITNTLYLLFLYFSVHFCILIFIMSRIFILLKSICSYVNHSHAALSFFFLLFVSLLAFTLLG